MADTDELVRRLRRRDREPLQVGEPDWWAALWSDCQQAADTIERLRDAVADAAETANGIEPALLEGKSETYVGVYCRARIDAANAIRAALTPTREER